MTLAFDLTKQFLTLAFAGIAFVVGLSFSDPGAIPTLWLWPTLVLFAFSIVVGLLFLMRSVSDLSQAGLDVYEKSLRVMAAGQILLVILGVGFLVPIVWTVRMTAAASPAEKRWR